MSVVSMTGFGRGEAHCAGTKVVVELGSVNRKQFDCHITIPRELAVLEARIHALIHVAVRRGHVKGTVLVARPLEGAKTFQIDMQRARARVKAIRKAARDLGLQDDLTASRLCDWHDVVSTEAAGLDPDAVWPLIEQATQQALKRFEAMRRREGVALARDLRARFSALRKEAAAIHARAPCVAQENRDALAARIAEAHSGLRLDDATLARELALLADRCDIREELTRLESHFDQAEKWLAGADSCGRTMDFLCQELFREINTIGSKANDALLARHVVTFKAELEAIREQVQNIE